MWISSTLCKGPLLWECCLFSQMVSCYVHLSHWAESTRPEWLYMSSLADKQPASTSAFVVSDVCWRRQHTAPPAAVVATAVWEEGCPTQPTSSTYSRETLGISSHHATPSGWLDIKGRVGDGEVHCGWADSCSSLGSHLHWVVFTHHRASWLLLVTVVPAPECCAVALVYWLRATALPPYFLAYICYRLGNWQQKSESHTHTPISPTNSSMRGQYAQEPTLHIRICCLPSLLTLTDFIYPFILLINFT